MRMIARQLVVVWTLHAAAVLAGDWPQILGPGRDGKAAGDEKLADRWPDAGPPIVWRKDVGAGYAGVAVAGDRVILFHRVADRDLVEALDARDGKTIWTDAEPTTFVPQVGGGDGPLCVPLVHEGKVITFGPQGVLTCLELASGRRLWVRRTHRDYGAQEGYFGAGSTPVVSGNSVVVNVGGTRQDAGIVAFALDTGETLWTKTAEPASYASPVLARPAGEPHVLIVTRYACLLLDPATGAIRWQFPFGQRGPTVNAAVPLVLDGDRLFVTASYGIGGICAAFDRATVRPVWQGQEPLATQYCTPIAVGDHLYCVDGRDDVPPADLKCVEAASGRVAWTEANFGYGTLVFADGKLVAAKTDGELVLMRANPAAAEVLSRARPLSGTVRALPALSGGRLYLRDDRTLICLAVAP